MTEKQIYKSAIEKWGKSLQLDVVIEEMAELTKEIIKFKRVANRIEKDVNDVELVRELIRTKDNIFQEIADVEIMLGQLKLMIDENFAQDEVDTYKIYKLKRLEKILTKEK